MKKLLGCLGLCLLLLTACANPPQAEEEPVENPVEISAPETPETPEIEEVPPEPAVTWSLRLVDGAGTDTLILTDENFVYDLRTSDIGTVLLDGEVASVGALQDGMDVEIGFDGTAQETFPAHLSPVSVLRASSEHGGGYFDLCGFYLQVLDDLCLRDEGLNGGAEFVSVDLSQAPGNLTEGERKAIAWLFARAHSDGETVLTPLTLSYEELRQQGYLEEIPMEGGREPLCQWKNGVLFRIAADADAEAAPSVLAFNADKWRSPLGAYMLSHCKAVWSQEGTWSTYTVESEAIA